MIDQLTQGILDAVKDNVQRSRFMTSLLVFACVLATIAFWNGKPDSWTRLRLIRQSHLAQLDSLVAEEMRYDSLLGYTLIRARRENIGLTGIKTLHAVREELSRLYRAKSIESETYFSIRQPVVDSLFVNHLLSTYRYPITPDKAAEYKKALVGVQDWTWELPAAREQATQLRRKFIDSTLVIDIPFFGLAFDINDLGLLAGLAFSLILMGIGYTLLREHNGMDTLIDLFEALPKNSEVERDVRIRLYQITAMQNVMTVPPGLFVTTSCGDAGRRLLRQIERLVFMLVSKLIYLVPVWIFTSIRDNDISTQAFGLTLSPARLAEQASLSTFFLITVWVLAIGAFIAAIRIEVRWVTLAGKVDH